ncbi:hypothetical protein P5673_022506, partial [Acropora cervicornis]
NQLFPTIYIYWQKYQSTMLSKLKALRDGIVIAGDGRHDSMGHSAKFGAYTIFCCTIPMIIHFALVQGDLRDAAQKLKEKSPAPMNEMLQKEPRDEALRERRGAR